MRHHVDAALFEQRQVFISVRRVQRLASHNLWATAVHLQRPNGGHQHHAIWNQSAVTALDIKELLHANVSTKARFRNHKSILTNQLERHLVCHNRRIAVRNICKRAGVHQCGRALERLHQRRFDSVAHEHRKRSAYTKIISGDWLTFAIGAHDHAPETLAHISQPGS